MSRRLFTATLVFLAVVATLSGPSAYAAVLLFDFGPTATASPSTSYNNVSGATTSISDLIDNGGNSTGMSMTVSGFNPGGNSAGTASPTGAASIFVSTATQDSLFGHSTTFSGTPPRPQATLVFSGLDATGDTLYTFDFFASRTGVSDNRSTQYLTTGATSSTLVLNASNNTSNIVTTPGLAADSNGQITITVSAGAGNTNSDSFYYLGAMKITTSAVPEPGRAMLLVIAAACLVGRRARGRVV